MIGKCVRQWKIWMCAALIGLSGNAQAAFHLWQINEVYSNADGTIQFIELSTSFGGQEFLQGHTISSSGGATTNTFTFPNSLSTSIGTAGRTFLIGTNGFAALGVVAPDYVVPNGFLFISNGTINFSNFDIFSYASLPIDGVLSLNRSMSTGTNSPTNFAGTTGTISPPANTIPGAPTIGTATAGLGQVSVTFTGPASNGGSPITGFTATCGAQNATGAASPIVVTGLATGVAVTCTVLATNVIGNGPPSAASNSVVPLGVPGAPTNVIAVAGDAQVTVTFGVPGNDGGSAIGSYTATCGGQSNSGAGSPLTVFGLANGVAVSCTVVATNAQGNSPPSAASNFVTPAAPATVPGAPVIGVAVAGNAQVTVNFSAPASDGGSAITAYTATCGALSAPGAGSPITVAGLTNGIAVTCTVIASNAIGNSLPSTASNSVTPAGVPGAPTIGAVTAGDAQVLVNFSAPGSDGGSVITGYTATCGAQSAGAAASPITVTGLTNGVAVTCRVVATNALGNSVPSAASSSVTPATLPAAPVIGTGLPGNVSALVAFSAPATDGGSPILNYTLSCVNPPNPGMAFSATGPASPLYVTGLINDLAYDCSVKATNAIGSGPASGIVVVIPATNSGMILDVVSRKLHNGVPFDLPITFSQPPGAPFKIEPRLIGTGHLIVFQFLFGFSNPGTLTVTPPVGNATATVVGTDVLVTLTGVPDNQRVTVTLTNIDGTGFNETATIGFLAGDVSGNGSVNAGDISAIKARQGQTVDLTNFRFDLNATGAINASDVSVVKSRSGVVLP